MITEVHQQGRFYRLSTGRAAHYEKLKPHVPSPEGWCVPQNMEGLEYLLVELIDLIGSIPAFQLEAIQS